MNTEGKPADGPEEMRYAMVGDDPMDAGGRLEKYTGEVGWSYLEPHFESGALLYVDPALTITEVGRAIGDDDTAKVEGWLKRGDLIKPGSPHAAHWKGSGARFVALVVSPFVLIQPCEPG